MLRSVVCAARIAACSGRVQRYAAGQQRMSYSLAEAAKAVHRNKTTLLRAIKSGKLSAVRDAATGGWLIEPAELHRVYPATADAALIAAPRSNEAEVEIRELRARLADQGTTIEDLRRRLDTATEQLGE